MEEDRPLGTAGSLGLLENSDQPLLVINGDILTGVDFRAMLQFHREQGADMTVAVRQHEVHIPYGVVEVDGTKIASLSEKPTIRHLIIAGIYLLNPGITRFVPSGRPYDMTDLITRVLEEGLQVVSFPVGEYWLDIGAHDDYNKAQVDAGAGELV